MLRVSWAFVFFFFTVMIEVSYTYVSRRAASHTSSLPLTTLEDLLVDVEDTPVALKMPRQLQNRYLGLRHGQSMANIAGIISSDPERGCKIHGLSNLGRAQARAACASLFEKIGGRNVDLTKVVFLSSNFTRARETAEECIKSLQLSLAIKHLYDTDPNKSSYKADNDLNFKEIDMLIYKLFTAYADFSDSLQDPNHGILYDILVEFKSQVGKALFYRIHHFAESSKVEHEQKYLSLLENMLSSIYINEDRDVIEAIEKEIPELDHIISSKYTMPVQIDNRLRERYFGVLDAELLITYNYVWPIDRIDANNKRYNVESVNEVVSRVYGLVHDLERQYTDKTIVMVSHADTLQIAQAFMANIDARTFSQIRFKNGEVRYMEEKGLPVPSPLEYKDPFESVGDKFEPVPAR